ncbi:MAG: ATP-binding protein [Gammaproteobacteria bacterium]|jgi:predicted AAA+ superfamily ATPase
MYLHRHLEKKIIELSKYFKILIIVGARQVGKSTLLQTMFPLAKQFVFDPVQDLYGTKKDPDLFLKQFKPPLILDEIQFAAELLPSLKRFVDIQSNNGLYFLTGSHNLSLMKNVAESLAGRACIIELDTMTYHEISNTTITQNSTNFLKLLLIDPEKLITNKSTLLNNAPLYDVLWRGGFPALTKFKNNYIANFFKSYINTYVERDVRLQDHIADIKEFSRFFALLSALSAQEINYSQLGREIGIVPNTAKKWCSILEQTYQYNSIQPYYGNSIKRISKKPKGYLNDTGMICYLLKISSPAMLAGHPNLGAIFETYCIHLCKVLAKTLDLEPNFYHWRTNGGAEVDLILEQDNQLIPIEFKCKTNVTKKDASSIISFMATYSNCQYGAIIYAGDLIRKITENIWLIPWNIRY